MNFFIKSNHKPLKRIKFIEENYKSVLLVLGYTLLRQNFQTTQNPKIENWTFHFRQE